MKPLGRLLLLTAQREHRAANEEQETRGRLRRTVFCFFRRTAYFNSTETLKKRLVEMKAALARSGERAQPCALSVGLPRSE